MKKVPPKQLFRIILALVVAIGAFALAASGAVRLPASPIMGKVMTSVGGLITVIFFFRMVFVGRARKSDDYDMLNSQFSVVMRQLNTIKRNIPKSLLKIENGQPVQAEIDSLLEIFRESQSLNTSDLAARYATFMPIYLQFLSDGENTLLGCGENRESAIGAMKNLDEIAQVVLMRASNERTRFFDNYGDPTKKV